MPSYGPLCTAFYDADKPQASDDELAWYGSRLPRDTGPVLDAMCGSGRLLAPLAGLGFHAHGVDTSSAMLAACESRLVAAGLTPTLFRQDVAKLNVPFRYGAAFIAGRSFQLLAEPSAAQAALERLRAHLVPPGWLLLDLGIPEAALHPPGAPLVEIRAVTLADGGRITLRSETSVNADARQLDTRSRYERRAAGLARSREDETRRLTWYDEAQIAALLEACGYVDVVIEPSPHADRDEREFGVRARTWR